MTRQTASMLKVAKVLFVSNVLFAPALATEGMTEGCYDQLDTHKCDCRTTAAICKTRGHMW
eukprot:CAMPEP_0172679602 /NCGR_PEP_ID=MMETSP1074-20121228/16177_1 /TAXON_ID=2916 /ORGANISM="Ceratium fusus, Strain PA161109" /LENGTH=60 /DNA_ID=CAMNT_0013497795 /DNA_START=22 /DNA_END=201 /DNA_ORIENTATION=-